MRWNTTIELIHYEREQGADGSFKKAEKVSETVFCNKQTIGHSALAGWTSANLKADAAVQVRTEDYKGQEAALFDGVEYTVERASAKGDFTVLTLGRMGRNA